MKALFIGGTLDRQTRRVEDACLENGFVAATGNRQYDLYRFVPQESAPALAVFVHERLTDGDAWGMVLRAYDRQDN